MSDNIEQAGKLILQRLEKKPFRAIWEQVPRLIEDFLLYDLHFMRLTGVVDSESTAEYDEDEAFEYIYDAYLSDHPEDDDENMLVATLLNRYMELKDECFDECGEV